ncbi:TPA: AAA family ATPase [Legionella pneumophila]|nr:AAA family ATPase [Legionella pneumophila]
MESIIPEKYNNNNENKIIALSLNELLCINLPPREYLLCPWLPKAGICMVYAKRGVGKTFFALEVAMAIACGANYLSFQALSPAKVLYIDGEMPANTMQLRLKEIEKRIKPSASMIQPFFITPDLQPDFMPNLSTLEGQHLIQQYVDAADLIIVDNLSTLGGSGRENEAESWITFQRWALFLRKRGKSVLFIHHAGKNGNQRGTSKREDILDTVIRLQHPANYNPSMGACFELHFEKTRNIFGENTKPMLCKLTETGWTYEPLKNDHFQEVIKLFNDGYSQSEIAEILKISKGYVSKLVQRGQLEGYINIKN